MSFGNTTETDVFNYIFGSSAPAWAGNANFWIALYSADPGEAGTAPTNESNYTGYARVAISRTTGFTVSGNSVSNAAQATFPASTGGAGTPATHFGIVTTASGAGQIILRGSLAASMPTSAGITPFFAANALQASID